MAMGAVSEWGPVPCSGGTLVVPSGIRTAPILGITLITVAGRNVFSWFFSFQRTLVGLVRDLRGIAFAFNAKTSFMMLFDWMYPLRSFFYPLSCFIYQT